MKSTNRRTIFRAQQLASLGLFSLIAATYTDSASAASYSCEYVTLANVKQGSTLTINANSTADALNQAKTIFQSQGINTSSGWIICT